jgi:hypothetical protein
MPSFFSISATLSTNAFEAILAEKFARSLFKNFAERIEFVFAYNFPKSWQKHRIFPRLVRIVHADKAAASVRRSSAFLSV